MSKTNVPSKVRKYMLSKYSCCQKCKDTQGLEVHHIIPIIKGGNNDEENLIVLCSNCHINEHKINRSELTKIGIEKSKNKQYTPLISKLDFYKVLNEILEVENSISVHDILDIIDELPIRGHRPVEIIE